MAYLKINNYDFSSYVSGLKVATKNIYKSQTTGSGRIQAKFVNSYKILEVQIIPLDAAAMVALQNQIKNFAATISFLNPETNAMETISGYFSDVATEYYTIQTSKTKHKAFSITFTEAITTPVNVTGG